MANKIQFFSEGVVFSLPNKNILRKWLQAIISAEGCSLNTLNYIFCSDAYLLQINQSFLQHDYYTDIITFDNSDFPNVIEGDIFISIDRVRENSSSLHTSFIIELARVMAHGILHLIGFDDHEPNDITRMRSKEESYLSLLSF